MFFTHSSYIYKTNIIRTIFVLLCCLFLQTSVLANNDEAKNDTLENTQASIVVNNATLWQNTKVFIDTTEKLTLANILANPPKFTKPSQPYSALSVNTKPIWLKIDLNQQNTLYTSEPLIFEINYPTLNIIDMYHVQNGQLVQAKQLGTRRPFNNHTLNERTFAMPIQFKAGAKETLYIKVASENVLILPMQVKSFKQFLKDEQKEQILQGFINGLMVMLLLYCGLKFYAKKQVIYLKYMGIVFSFILLNMYHFGIGQQFFWTNNTWVDAKIAGIATFLMFIFLLLFAEETLKHEYKNKLFSKVLKTLAGLNTLLLLLFVFGIFNESFRHVILFFSGVFWFFVIPIYIYCLIKRSVMGLYLTIASLIQVISFTTISLVISGWLPNNFWTLHSLQFGFVVDSALFLMTVMFFIKKEDDAKNEIILETNSLKELVIKDDLTGLYNRRGIIDALDELTQSDYPNNKFTIFYIDLNEFKLVNDTHGHDVGDALLKQVANLLSLLQLENKLVGRMGGDEFIVIAQQVDAETEAHQIKQLIEKSFQTPINLHRLQIKVTISLGYAIYPVDTNSWRELLILADTAMYTEKKLSKL